MNMVILLMLLSIFLIDKATLEAPIHDNIKQALVKGGASSTTLIMRSVKNSERVFKNETATTVQELERSFFFVYDWRYFTLC